MNRNYWNNEEIIFCQHLQTLILRGYEFAPFLTAGVYLNPEHALKEYYNRERYKLKKI